MTSINKKSITEFAIIIAMAISVMFAGCESGQKEQPEEKKEEPASSPEENPYQSKLDAVVPAAYTDLSELELEPGEIISMIGRGGNSSFYWKEVEEGAEQAVNDINENLGYKGSDKVKLSYVFPSSEYDVDDQVSILDEELDRYPSAIGVAVVDMNACEVQFDLAAENGIPVILFDSGSEYQNIVSRIDTDNHKAGAEAADWLCEQIGDSGEVVAVIHDRRSTSAKEREKAFLDRIAEAHPQVTVADVYYMEHPESVSKESSASKDVDNEEELRKVLALYPGVKGIFSSNEDAANAVIAAQETLSGNQSTGSKEVNYLPMVSFDGGEKQRKRLEEGKIGALVVQNPYGMGYATVVACARGALGLANQADVDTGYVFVTADNMNDEQITKRMY